MKANSNTDISLLQSLEQLDINTYANQMNELESALISRSLLMTQASVADPETEIKSKVIVSIKAFYLFCVIQLGIMGSAIEFENNQCYCSDALAKKKSGARNDIY